MKLLTFFSPDAPEIGLGELSRLAEFDKAATRRFLVALSQHAFIEQNPETRKYRLGPAFLRYARTREITSPLASIVQPILKNLVATVGETAHCSIATDSYMMTIGYVEAPRPTRIAIDTDQPLPFHATASGRCYLAFGAKAVVERYLKSGQLTKHTSRTVTSVKLLRTIIAEIRELGYSVCDRTFDEEVVGIAAPIIDAGGLAIGAIAVASLPTRLDEQAKTAIAGHIMKAADAIRYGLGGLPDSHPCKGNTQP